MKYIEIDGIRSDVPDCLFCPCYERDEDKGWCHHLLRRGMPIEEYVDGVAEFCPLREEDGEVEEKLRPCPFCGKEAYIELWEGRSDRFIVGCKKCRLRSTGPFPSKKTATIWWNRREFDVEF